MASIVAYHGVTASDHQARFDQLAPHGFRPLSLNVCGDPGDARYAAVWIQRPGVEWVAMHGVDAATYQARFDELVAQGLSPSIVSATGPAGSASFTTLFERVPRRWFARHVVTLTSVIQGTCAGASSRADGLDFAYAFNRRVPDAVHDGITQAIHAVLNRQGAGL